MNNKIKEKITKGKELGKKEKIILSTALLSVFLLLLIAGLYYMHQAEKMQQKFGSRLKVNGQIYEGKTADQVAEEVKAEFENCQLILKENGEQIYQITLGEAGYTLDEEKLKNRLEEMLKKQTPIQALLRKELSEVMEYPVTFSQEMLNQAITAEKIGGDRKDSVNAYMDYDEGKKEYMIVPEVQGNKLDDAALQKVVGTSLEEQLTGQTIPSEVTVSLDESVYLKPEVTSEQEELKTQVESLNSQMEVYRNTSVTYLFGETKETITSDLICSWLTLQDGKVMLQEEPVRDYIRQLAEKYNTIFVKRQFQTSLGSTVWIKENEYGYRIDQEGEFEQLYGELSSGQAIEREPLYNKKGYQRNGNDDLMGSYLELSIQSQHLWLYKDGKLITETDVVTGLPTPERATMEGAWPIAYKARNFEMSSETYGYNVTVDYWMPFVLGQGLHDMKSRAEFGGTIYQTSGSHGCVNLPLDQAKIIYDTIDAGYPILIY